MKTLIHFCSLSYLWANLAGILWFSLLLLCKSQGAEPSILRFLFIFFVRPSFLPCEDKNPPSAISCSFISKLVTVLPFQSKNRTLLLATDRF